MYVSVCVGILNPCSQDLVFFIPPPPHCRGSLAAFSPSINECWYGCVNLIFKMRIRTDAGLIKECQCALIETLYNYCPGQAKTWWPNTARLPILEPSACTCRHKSLWCTLFRSPTSWASCP